jgi:hypothetical protein
MNSFLIKHIHSWDKTKPNIAHFFHEIVFHALDKYLKDPTIHFIIDTTLSEWESKFIHLLIKHLNITYSYNTLYYNCNDAHYERNIQIFPSFSNIMNLIQTIIHKEYPDIVYTGNYKVLYLRNECDRRKMLNYNSELNKHFDIIISDMSQLTFEEQVKLFMKCSHFITIDGAQLTNIIFMNKDAIIYNISTTNNCWTIMFGLSKIIKTFTLNVLNYTNFNDNIEYTDTIRDAILKAIEVPL